MNAKELAENLTGIEYPCDIPTELTKEAKASGLVIVYGGSDDLMEFEGAIHDEVGAYGGTTVKVYSSGLLPDFEQISDDKDKDLLREYFLHENDAKEIEALWCNEGDYSWTYKTDIPHSTFEIVEDGEPYCRGIVFALKDCA
jgi:hypothetical protein